MTKSSEAINSAVTVGSSSTLVSDTLWDRQEITMTNDSDEVIYIALGEAAVMNSGIRINASGGSHTEAVFTGAIYAICASGSKNLVFTQKRFTRP